MANVNATNNDRISGAAWFHSAAKTTVVIGGAGGISSWLTLFLTRAGITTLVYDFDTVSNVNLAGQFYTNQFIGIPKVNALEYEISRFSDMSKFVGYNARFRSNSSASSIMLSGFDNMEARKDFYHCWKNGIEPSKRADYLLIDGRLQAEQLQILCVHGNNDEQLQRYEDEYLFDDGLVPDAPCTFKQTSHMAAMIAGLMTGYTTNFITNRSFDADINDVPFFHEYLLPINKNTDVYYPITDEPLIEQNTIKEEDGEKVTDEESPVITMKPPSSPSATVSFSTDLMEEYQNLSSSY